MFRTERFRRLFKEGFWVVVGQAMAVLGALAGVRLLTELLDPAAYGELALGITVATLINQTVLGPLSNGVTRFYAPAFEQGNIGSYLRAVRRLVLSATGIIILMLPVMVFGLLIAGQSVWITITVVALIFSILSGYNSILSGIQNSARQRTIVALHQGMESWVRFLVAAGLMVLLGTTSTVAMIGYVVAVVLVLSSQYVFFCEIIFRKINEENEEKRFYEDILKYSLPFASWGIFSWLRLTSDRWAIGMFETTREVGLYAVLYQLGYYPIAMATGLATQFFAPIIFQRAGDASNHQRIVSVDKLTWQLTALALGITVCAFIFGFLFHKQIFNYLVAEEYLAMSYLLPWMLLAGGIFAAAQPIGLNIQSKMKPSVMAVAIIISSLFGVISNFAGAYLFGISGVVFSSIAFSILYSVWMTILFIKTITPVKH